MLFQDVRYGLRALRREPGFAALAVLTLGLGIGSATTIFSVIQNVVLDPYPYANTDRCVNVQIRDARMAGRRGSRSVLQVPEFLDYAEQVDAFEEVIAGGFEDVLYSTGQGTEQWNGGLVSGNVFQFLGLPASQGRILTPEDAKPGAPPVFMMRYKFWVSRFGAEPGLVGRTFVLNGAPRTLVGITSPRVGKLAADVYLPVTLDRADGEGSQRFYMFQARLKPGVTLAQAEEQFGMVAQRLAKVYPKLYPEKFTVKVETWIDQILGQFRTTLYTLAAAVGLLLLIACVNVANMLLSRAAVREREMAIRSSLGASRRRLVRQLLVESLILALLGAAFGCAFAQAGITWVVSAIPEGTIPREAVIRLNVPVLLFSLLAAVLTSVLCGLVPALQTARRDLVEPLKDTGKGAGGGSRRRGLANSLVVAEVALSLVLLAGAGLLMRSFFKLQTVDLGLDPQNVFTARLPLPRGTYDAPAAKHQFLRRVATRLQALPGVKSAAVVAGMPLYGGPRTEMDVPGIVHEAKWQGIFDLCSEGVFETLGLRLQRGRVFTESEVDEARKVAVVNRTLVDRFFGAADPLGRTVVLQQLASLRDGALADPSFEIVGVVADVPNQGLQDPTLPAAYVPFTVTGAFDRGILVRSAGPLAALPDVARREIWAVDPSVAVSSSIMLADALKQYSYAEPRFGLVVMSWFAGVGLVLVALGVFSVIAYTVSRQTHEIGIRMALGAAGTDVLGMVLSAGLRLVGLGVAVGVLASLGATRVLASQLFGVAPTDPLTLSAVIVVVGLAGLFACTFPALRAARVQPMVALRHE